MAEKSNPIVVGIDGSADSIAALKWAENYASRVDAPLRLVTTWMWPQTYGAPLVFDNFDPAAIAQEVLEKARAEITASQPRIETICRQGGAGPVLVAESEDADLLVVGSHGHGGIGSLLLGSVSNYCVHHACCAVVVVR